MKQSTVDALDEADRLNAQMDWLLFIQEQDRRLFGYSPIIWEPGNPLDKYWVVEDDDGEEHWRPLNADTIRPIFQILNDLFWVKEYLNYYNRCRLCQTWWATDEPCWVCGEEREPMSAEWKRLQFFCYAMGMDKTEEEIDEMLILATQRAEEARQQRREAMRKMTEDLSRSLELATTQMQNFGSMASRSVANFEMFGWPQLHWGSPFRHEPDNNGLDDGNLWRRANIRGLLGYGRPRVQMWVDEASSGDNNPWVSYWDFPRENVEIYKKKPFTWPDISRRYNPYVVTEGHMLRSTRVLISRYAYGQVPKLKPIVKEPVITLGNPILEEYLRREQNQTPNTRRQHEVRGNRGRSDAGPQRMRSRAKSFQRQQRQGVSGRASRWAYGYMH